MLQILMAIFFTVLSWVVYFGFYSCIYHVWKKRIYQELETKIVKLAMEDPEGKKVVELWNGSSRRENSMIVMGSIFIAGSFVLLGAASQLSTATISKIALALASPILYVVWLFSVQLSTRLMNDVEFDMRLICEKSYGPAAILREFYGEKHGRDPVMWMRRNHWLVYIPLLIAAATAIVSPN